MGERIREISTGFGWVVLSLLYLSFAVPALIIIFSYLFDYRDGFATVSHIGIPVHDFGAFWLAGWLTNQGDFQSIYHPDMFRAELGRILDAPGTGLGWYYPPQSLPMVSFVAILPPKPAFLLWTLGLPILAYSLLRRAGYDRFIVTCMLFSPPMLINSMGGQRGLLLAMLAMLGSAVINRSGGRVGIFLGLVVLKPGAMLLVPVALLALRAWRILAWAVVGGSGLTLIAWALYGENAFVLYWNHTVPDIRWMLENDHRVSAWRNATTVFWSLRAFDFSVAASLAAQAVASVAVVAVVYAVGRSSHANPKLTVALALILSPMASSYGFVYDMVGYAGGLALASRAAGREITLFDGFLWLAPMLVVLLATVPGYDFSLMPVVILAAAAYMVGVPMWRSARASGS